MHALLYISHGFCVQYDRLLLDSFGLPRVAAPPSSYLPPPVLLDFFEIVALGDKDFVTLLMGMTSLKNKVKTLFHIKLGGQTGSEI